MRTPSPGWIEIPAVAPDLADAVGVHIVHFDHRRPFKRRHRPRAAGYQVVGPHPHVQREGQRAVLGGVDGEVLGDGRPVAARWSPISLRRKATPAHPARSARSAAIGLMDEFSIPPPEKLSTRSQLGGMKSAIPSSGPDMPALVKASSKVPLVSNSPIGAVLRGTSVQKPSWKTALGSAASPNHEAQRWMLVIRPLLVHGKSLARILGRRARHVKAVGREVR